MSVPQRTARLPALAVHWVICASAGLDLYRCGLRFYDVANARWLTRDPIGQSGGVNLYAYVSGNPIMSIDPGGMDIDWGLISDTTLGFLGGATGFFLGGGGALRAAQWWSQWEARLH